MLERMIKYYDELREAGKPVCPIAHTYITAHIAVLLDKNGKFLCAQKPEVEREMVCVPCTIQSAARTSGAAPHLLSDNLAYVTSYPGYEERHALYIEQLRDYVAAVPGDAYAKAVYTYTRTEALLEDIKDILPQIENSAPAYRYNVIFLVYKLPNEGEDLHWTEYYLSTLYPNGICSITAKRDYIPQAYPACFLTKGGGEKLFVEGAGVGYIASQKIIHALQYQLYGQKNHDRVEAEYKIKAYMSGEISDEKFKKWIDEKYPGAWEGFIERLNTAEETESEQ